MGEIQNLVDRISISGDDGEDAMRGKWNDRKGQVVENDGQEKRNSSWMMNWMPF
jgi:hypothetical protein